jgi:rubrerythrin
MVVVDFNDIEACKIAAKIERDGLAFYEALAGRMADPSARETVLSLARQEGDHLDFFRDELARLTAMKEDPFEEDDLADVLDYGIFAPYRDLAEAVKSPEKALTLGLLVEERTVRFYEACRDRVGSAETRQELERIIGEERAHAQKLREMRAALPKA